MPKNKRQIALGAVGRRIEKALYEMYWGLHEDVLINACIAVDATSAKTYPARPNAERNKLFLRTNMNLIMLGMFDLCVTGSVRLSVQHPDLKLAPGEVASFEAIIYHVLRCSMLHEGVLPEGIRLTKTGEPRVISIGNGKIPTILPWELGFGLVLAVVGAKANAYERITTNYSIGPIEINSCWGKSDQIAEIWMGK